MLTDLDLTAVTSPEDVSVVRYICAALSLRGAQLVCASKSVCACSAMLVDDALNMLCDLTRKVTRRNFVLSELAVLVKRIGKECVTIAMDGSLYRYHPKIHNHMTTWLKHLAPEIQACCHVFALVSIPAARVPDCFLWDAK